MLADQLLCAVGEAQQVEPLRDQPLASPDQPSELRAVAVLVGQAAVGAGFLDRGQVGADHVLGDRQCEGIAVGVSHLRGHLAELRRLGGSVAALASDDRVAVLAVGCQRQGCDDAVALDGGDQLGHLLVGELGAWVVLAGTDLRQRDHGQRGGHRVALPSVRSCSAVSLSGCGSVARSNRASVCVRVAVRRVGWVWST